MQQPAPEVPATETETSTSKDKIKFLLLEGIHPSAVAVIQAAGYTQIESIAGALSGEALESKLRGVHFLGTLAGWPKGTNSSKDGGSNMACN